jgi:YD repeat-containing protein
MRAAITGAGGSRSFVYDGRGNLTSETRGNGPLGGTSISAGYDGHGRLTSNYNSGNASLSHQYNGLDDRIATTTISGGASDTRRFVYAPDGRVLGESQALRIKSRRSYPLSLTNNLTGTAAKSGSTSPIIAISALTSISPARR